MTINSICSCHLYRNLFGFPPFTYRFNLDCCLLHGIMLLVWSVVFDKLDLPSLQAEFCFVRRNFATCWPWIISSCPWLNLFRDIAVISSRSFISVTICLIRSLHAMWGVVTYSSLNQFRVFLSSLCLRFLFLQSSLRLAKSHIGTFQKLCWWIQSLFDRHQLWPR